MCRSSSSSTSCTSRRAEAMHTSSPSSWRHHAHDLVVQGGPSTLLRINPLPTPIYGCNMAILVASGISCIEVRWSTNGCNWNGAIAWGNRKMMYCNRVC
jgi:hypothetical protein